MAAHTYTAEFKSPIAPARLFNASVLHLHDIAHKVMPVVVKSGAIVEGDGGVGTIKEYLFTEVLPFKNGMVEPSADGGSICKLEGQIESLEGVQYTEEDKEMSMEGSLATYKAVDEYLQANPDVYA
ncbi:hypothetical protein Sjap_007378 [Stephania japonica]|uniref:Bet v I/Major latex protein domain-containing protein n=1 Tax=Stephania japonica TaxID=461633 RepID=A0AAP0JMW7_9MAGN